MSKLIGISIDVTKIPREAIIAHKNGAKYVGLDIWINDEPDKFGNDASVSIKQSKEERDTKERKVYVGNGKKLFGFGDAPRQSEHNEAKSNAYQPQADDDLDQIPF